MIGSGGASVLIAVALGLALVSGLLWWVGRRIHGRGSSSPARRSIRLTATDSLHVIELEGRRLLVGTGAGASPRLICELQGNEVPSLGRAGGMDVA